MTSTRYEPTVNTYVTLKEDKASVKLMECIPINIPSCETQLQEKKRLARRILNFLKTHLSGIWCKKLILSNAQTTSNHTVEERDEIAVLVPSPSDSSGHFHANLIKKVVWARLIGNFKEWIGNPGNIALLIWLLCVVVSASMLGLLLLGILDQAFPTKSSRNHWIEINNQILNALFTLMSLFQHPKLFHHFILLCRWSPEDTKKLRRMYCKSAPSADYERAHMAVAVVLLHITCFAHYALCGLYWGYPRAQRPEFVEDFLLALGTISPILAGAYTVYSPLGRHGDTEIDQEDSDFQLNIKVELESDDQRVMASRSEWSGGLFDCQDDLTMSCLSFFCTFCVSGWNLERLGFGNMYIHITTFFLLCTSPFWIFNVTALNIRDEVIGDIMGISGIVLCAFGLLYGGYWRVQMRKKFKLHGSSFCCYSESMTDYIQWIFCWACSLGQEVRTANLYDVRDGSFYKKRVENDEAKHEQMLVEAREVNLIGSNVSPISDNVDVAETDCQDEIEVLKSDLDDAMAPPIHLSMNLDSRTG